MDVGVGMMQVEVTNRCNLNCPHCFYYEAGEKGEDYNNFLNLKAMDKLLNDLGIRYIRTLNFTGGEPLLNTEGIIYSLHQILKSNCVVLGIDIPTNGTILDEKFAYELNEFSKNMYDLIENNENKIIAGVVKRYNHLPDRCIAMLRISRNFHDNNPEKAYEFYKERMPNVCVERSIFFFKNEDGILDMVKKICKEK